MRLNFIDLWHEEYRKLPPCEQVYALITGVVFLPILLGLVIGYKLKRREE